MVKPEEWQCTFRISGLPVELTETIAGADSVEAILLALQGLRFYLEKSHLMLTMQDGEPGILGIPRLIPDSFGLQVEHHLIQHVNDEVSRLVEAKRKARSKGDDDE